MNSFIIRIFTLGLLFLMSQQVHSQVSFEIGARAGFGFNGATINGNVDTSKQTLLFTPSFNFVAELGFGNKVFIQPELGFTQKGWRIGEDEVLLGDNYYVERLNYREIPILVKIAVKSDEKSIITAYAGPSFNHLNKATEKINFLSEEKEIIHDLTNTEIYKVSAVGFVLGVGTKATLGTGHFVADLRLTSGSRYKELTDGGNTTSFSAWSANFSIGYMFSLTN